MGSCASVVLHSSNSLLLKGTETSEKVEVDWTACELSDGRHSPSVDSHSSSNNNIVMMQGHEKTLVDSQREEEEMDSSSTNQTDHTISHHQEDDNNNCSLLNKKRNSLMKPNPVHYRSIPFIIVSQSTQSQLSIQNRAKPCNAFLCVPDDIKSL